MLIATDPLSLVFIACFLFGLLFLMGTALLGNLGHGHAGIHGASHHIGLHVGGQGHVPHAVVHGTHVTGHGTHAAGHAQTPGHRGNVQSTSQSAQGNVLSFINPTSIVLFLLGFGLFGYIFHTANLMLSFTLAFAGISGIIIAALLLLMLSRIFGDSEANTVQDIADRTGVLGKVSITIPENSMGEIIYLSPAGMRKSVPARSTDGRRLERGQEVVVVNYQRGVAEVDTWERFINDEDASRSDAPASHEDDLAQLRTLLEETDSKHTGLAVPKDLQKE